MFILELTTYDKCKMLNLGHYVSLLVVFTFLVAKKISFECTFTASSISEPCNPLKTHSHPTRSIDSHSVSRPPHWEVKHPKTKLFRPQHLARQSRGNLYTILWKTTYNLSF